jgi:NAD(P)-dependent dehydrogenase (short-subunit alcohol dehydrogenase family)
MYESLAHKVALVTGAGAGIGRAIAMRLGREGSVLAVNDVRVEALTETVEMLTAAGVRASGWPGDMTNERAVGDLIQKVAASHGGLDILVNNVGLFTFGDLATLDTAEWERCFDINVKSTFLGVREAIPFLRQPGASIINISSGAGKIGGTRAGGYSAAKWAVIGLTKSLANELAPGIRVNAVCPGIIVTEMDGDYVARAAEAAGMTSQRLNSERLERIPMHRNGSPEDVANAVAFLCSDQAAYTTGEAFNVSGGMVMN